MKLLGLDIPARELISRIEERLRTRGLPTSEPVEAPAEGVEPRVEPLTFNLHALEENADATRALPLHTHRGGAGQLVLVAKWAFRKSCQVFINEALGRQRVFNGHVRDAYAQLSAEVIRLRREVEELKARGGGRPSGEDRRPMPAQSSPLAKPAPSERPGEARESAAKAAPGAEPTLSEEREPAAKTAPSAKPTPAMDPSRRPGEFPSSAEPATSARAAPAERDPGLRAPGAFMTPQTQTALPTSKPPTGRKSAPAAKAAPATKAGPRSKPASRRKPTAETKAAPLTAGEPVLPRPRGAGAGEGQQPRVQEGVPRARPETPAPKLPTTGNAGKRSRKPGSQRSGRRK